MPDTTYVYIKSYFTIFLKYFYVFSIDAVFRKTILIWIYGYRDVAGSWGSSVGIGGNVFLTPTVHLGIHRYKVTF